MLDWRRGGALKAGETGETGEKSLSLLVLLVSDVGKRIQNSLFKDALSLDPLEALCLLHLWLDITTSEYPAMLMYVDVVTGLRRRELTRNEMFR